MHIHINQIRAQLQKQHRRRRARPRQQVRIRRPQRAEQKTVAHRTSVHKEKTLRQITAPICRQTSQPVNTQVLRPRLNRARVVSEVPPQYLRDALADVLASRANHRRHLNRAPSGLVNLKRDIRTRKAERVNHLAQTHRLSRVRAQKLQTRRNV